MGGGLIEGGKLVAAHSSTGLRGRTNGGIVVEIERGPNKNEGFLTLWVCEAANCFSDPEDECPCGRFYIDEDTPQIEVIGGIARIKGVTGEDAVVGYAMNCRQLAALLVRTAVEMERVADEKFAKKAGPR